VTTYRSSPLTEVVTSERRLFEDQPGSARDGSPRLIYETEKDSDGDVENS